ncbi:MAG: DUF5906 domain-containing protein [Paracoccus sp. (in: a-proteobacteria)]|uniref:DUF5906 domain-containing protein n=1 Tax=Paracoccus sp. TaxID=267 RepID=UPI0026E0BB3B|nr:DUF5906 domain-containing protein [Paracoccus sp. (in: a-proteobacteria)]MDO5630527.1 DUF5906 domain-containing protein [Paracoccus sp. (in: a-proteobacteria)]
MPLDNSESARRGQDLSIKNCDSIADLLELSETHGDASGHPLDATNCALIAAGASLHWLVAGQKRPVAADWSALPNQTESDLRGSYRQGANVGIRLGEPSKVGTDYLHLIDLDVRDPSKAAEAWGALLAIWPQARTYPSVISGSGGESRHLYFLTSAPFRKHKIAKSTGFTMVFDASKGREVKKNDWEIDLMGTGSQAVIPPSIHPDTGLPYIWERPVDLTLGGLGMWVNADQVARFGARQDTGSTGEPAARLDEVNPDHLAQALAFFDVDDRDDWKDVGMALHHQFAGSNKGYSIWNEWAKASSKHIEKDSRTVWKSFKADKPGALGISHLFDRAGIDGYGRGVQVLDDDFDDLPELPVSGKRNPVNDLNRDHAAVMIGGKFRIIIENGGDYEVFNDTELHKMNANRRVKVPGTNRSEPVTAAWMRHPQRREYRGGLVFNPKETPVGAYNIWRGWAVQPDPDASCDLFLAHVRDVICDGSERDYHWLLGWMAHLVQHPEQKPGTAVVLRGAKGAGKDTVGHYLGALFPRHHVTLSQPEHLTGRFNAHMETAILIHLEEGYWAGDHRAEGVLKNLITCQSLEIERKGIDPYKIDHFGRLLITSNAEWVVPATPGERRFFVLDVSPAHAKDTAYFGAIWKEQANGGAGALLHFLQSFDLSDFDVRNPPETAALTRQKLEGLRNVDAWWYDRLSEGDLSHGVGDGFDSDQPTWETSAITVARDALRCNYEAWLERQRWHGAAISSERFGKKLLELCGDIQSTRPRVSGERTRSYTVPPLAQCRSAFATFIGSEVDWDQ